MDLAPPDAVTAVVGDAPWAPVSGRGRARVWSVGRFHVKLVPVGAPGPGAGAEAARLRWLDGRLPAPRPVAEASDAAGQWLVTPTASGRPAALVDRHPDAGVLVAAVADGLRRLHALPVEACPFDAGWSRLDDEVADALDRGRIDPGTLDPPFDRYPAARLVELWRLGRPAAGDPVVVHGDARLDHLVLDGPALTAVLGVGRLGVGDRHLDLAVAHQSIQRHLGPNAVFAFYDAYGMDPDLASLEHHRLGALLR